jgi:hypothetical protein
VLSGVGGGVLMLAWVNRNLATVALVIACTSMALGFWSYSGVLRAACEDRNRRDAQIFEAVVKIAEDLGAEPHTIDPLEDALAPRDCEQLYPRLPL